jgi:hypothetical protein
MAAERHGMRATPNIPQTKANSMQKECGRHCFPTKTRDIMGLPQTALEVL